LVSQKGKWKNTPILSQMRTYLGKELFNPQENSGSQWQFLGPEAAPKSACR